MKKILMIEINPDFEIGGAETYNRKLFNILKSHFKEEDLQIDRACLFQPKSFKQYDKTKLSYKYYFVKSNYYCHNKQNFNEYVKFTLNVLKFRKLIYKLNKLNNYDLIIDSTVATLKKLAKNDNYFWIQHTDASFFNEDLKFNLKNFIKKIFGFESNIYYAKNIVFYDEANLNYIKSRRKSNFIGYCIPLSCNVPKNLLPIIKNQCIERTKIVYFGRLENNQKNIQLIQNINRKLNLIEFYGEGETNIKLTIGNSYKGYISPAINPQLILNKYKFLILMSNFEGFSYSLVQALSFGIPIIVRNTFLSAKTLVDSGKNGFLLPANDTVEEYAKKIKEIYNIDSCSYCKMCENAYRFALMNLDDSFFEKRWLEIFNKFLN